jgi:hypothetical protein
MFLIVLLGLSGYIKLKLKLTRILKFVAEIFMCFKMVEEQCFLQKYLKVTLIKVRYHFV